MDPQELIDTLPPAAKAFVMTGRPGLKDQPADPADFYGREGELATLMRAVQTVTTGQTKTTARPAEVIAAAPGAGKTSLLNAFERKLAEAGIGHIRLDPKDMLTPEAFSTAVKKHPPYCYFADANAALKKTANTIAVVIDSAIHLTTYATTKLVTLGQAEAPNTEVTRKVIETWREGKTPEPIDVVRAISTMWTAGTVVTVDEAQDLADLAAEGKPHDCATEIISALASRDPRDRAGVERATICFFGLADTPQTVHGLGSPTVNTMVLTPLHRDYVRMMINGAIAKATSGRAELSAWAEQEWTETLTQEFDDWTRHAQAATEAAHDLLAHFGNELIDSEWGTRAVRALADDYKQSTYRNIRRRAANKGVETWMRDLAVQALWCNGNAVNQGTLRDLLRRYIEQKKPKLEPKQVDDQRDIATQRLLRSGIMDTTDDLPKDHHRVAFYAPIPSLLHHLSQDEVAEPEVVRQLLSEHGLNGDPQRRPEEQFQPQWVQWTPELAAALRTGDSD